ncbi:MAG: transcriptional regulator [Alphaproteobacteria bacterium]|nr:transcriptional regulator [Alphaproteobacteria bacterium]
MVQIAYARRPLARQNTRAGLTPLGPDQFEGYASLWGVIDGAGDDVAPGAFAASLRRRGPAQVRMLYQHFSHAPIGVWEEIREDRKGLYVRGRLVADVGRRSDGARLNMEYEYKASGLDNVKLLGIQIVLDADGDACVVIKNVNELHKAIAEAIVNCRRGVSGKELRFLRTLMGKTQAELAGDVNKDTQSVGRWERGEYPIDANAEAFIRLMAREKLELRLDASVGEVTGWSAQTGDRWIRIDARNPDKYRSADLPAVTGMTAARILPCEQATKPPLYEILRCKLQQGALDVQDQAESLAL